MLNVRRHLMNEDQFTPRQSRRYGMTTGWVLLGLAAFAIVVIMLFARVGHNATDAASSTPRDRSVQLNPPPNIPGEPSRPSR
jgi:hypothetical protein